MSIFEDFHISVKKQKSGQMAATTENIVAKLELPSTLQTLVNKCLAEYSLWKLREDQGGTSERNLDNDERVNRIETLAGDLRSRLYEVIGIQKNSYELEPLVWHFLDRMRVASTRIVKEEDVAVSWQKETLSKVVSGEIEVKRPEPVVLPKLYSSVRNYLEYLTPSAADMKIVKQNLKAKADRTEVAVNYEIKVRLIQVLVLVAQPRSTIQELMGLSSEFEKKLYAPDPSYLDRTELRIFIHYLKAFLDKRTFNMAQQQELQGACEMLEQAAKEAGTQYRVSIHHDIPEKISTKVDNYLQKVKD